MSSTYKTYSNMTTTSDEARRSIYVKLASESTSGRECDESDSTSYGSVYNKETDYCYDTSDTESMTTIASEGSYDQEYEVPSTSSCNPEYFSDSSSDGPDNDLYLRNKKVHELVEDINKNMSEFADGEDETTVSDPELTIKDYWTCNKCKNRKNRPYFTICEKCFQIRKSHFPLPPKGRKRKLQTNLTTQQLSSEKENAKLSKNVQENETEKNAEIDNNNERQNKIPKTSDFINVNSKSDQLYEPCSSVYSVSLSSSQNKNKMKKRKHNENDNDSEIDTGKMTDFSSSDNEKFHRINKFKRIRFGNLNSECNALIENSLETNSLCNKNSEKIEIDSRLETIPAQLLTESQTTISSVDSGISTGSSSQESLPDNLVDENLERKKQVSNSEILSSTDSGFSTTTINGSQENICEDDSPISKYGNCIICLTEPKNGVFVHSKVVHVCCCYNCAVKVWSKRKRCPICNVRVKNVIKLFVY